jgi:hypothetical protein
VLQQRHRGTETGTESRQTQSESHRENDESFEDSWNEQVLFKCAILGLLFLILWWVLFLKAESADTRDVDTTHDCPF